MIWLLGCNGMLGRELSALLKKNNIAYIGSGREIDITDIEAILEFVKNKSLKWIINCAAYTAVDRAEDDVFACVKINTDGAAHIAEAASQCGAKIIHISTDYVFNGNNKKPYSETDETNPLGIYGRSKRDGEEKIISICNDSYIIRTSWLYGKYGKNFVSTMLKLMQEKESIKVVNDQHGSPTWTFDLANTIIHIIQHNGTAPFGIYNYTNEGETTWYDFAQSIYKNACSTGLLKNGCIINSCTTDEYPAKAHRPAYSYLNKNKIKQTFGITIPNWEDSLKNYLNELSKELSKNN
jgi:dTDP-4-dehydrorhamnose reductase